MSTPQSFTKKTGSVGIKQPQGARGSKGKKDAVLLKDDDFARAKSSLQPEEEEAEEVKPMDPQAMRLEYESVQTLSIEPGQYCKVIETRA